MKKKGPDKAGALHLYTQNYTATSSRDIADVMKHHGLHWNLQK